MSSANIVRNTHFTLMLPVEPGELGDAWDPETARTSLSFILKAADVDSHDMPVYANALIVPSNSIDGADPVALNLSLMYAGDASDPDGITQSFAKHDPGSTDRARPIADSKTK